MASAVIMIFFRKGVIMIFFRKGVIIIFFRKGVIMIFFQYRHIGDTADRYRCRQTDSSIADTDTSIGIVANPASGTKVVYR